MSNFILPDSSLSSLDCLELRNGEICFNGVNANNTIGTEPSNNSYLVETLKHGRDTCFYGLVDNKIWFPCMMNSVPCSNSSTLTHGFEHTVEPSFELGSIGIQIGDMWSWFTTHMEIKNVSNKNNFNSFLNPCWSLSALNSYNIYFVEHGKIALLLLDFQPTGFSGPKPISLSPTAPKASGSSESLPQTSSGKQTGGTESQSTKPGNAGKSKDLSGDSGGGGDDRPPKKFSYLLPGHQVELTVVQVKEILESIFLGDITVLTEAQFISILHAFQTIPNLSQSISFSYHKGNFKIFKSRNLSMFIGFQPGPVFDKKSSDGKKIFIQKVKQGENKKKPTDNLFILQADPSILESVFQYINPSLQTPLAISEDSFESNPGSSAGEPIDANASGNAIPPLSQDMLNSAVNQILHHLQPHLPQAGLNGNSTGASSSSSHPGLLLPTLNPSLNPGNLFATIQAMFPTISKQDLASLYYYTATTLFGLNHHTLSSPALPWGNFPPAPGNNFYFAGASASANPISASHATGGQVEADQNVTSSAPPSPSPGTASQAVSLLLNIAFLVGGSLIGWNMLNNRNQSRENGRLTQCGQQRGHQDFRNRIIQHNSRFRFPWERPLSVPPRGNLFQNIPIESESTPAFQVGQNQGFSAAARDYRNKHPQHIGTVDQIQDTSQPPLSHLVQHDNIGLIAGILLSALSSGVSVPLAVNTGPIGLLVPFLTFLFHRNRRPNNNKNTTRNPNNNPNSN